MVVGIISHPDCDKHETGPDRPERPARLQAIRESIKKYPFTIPIQHYEAPPVTRKQLARVHDHAFIRWIYSISPVEGIISIDEDTAMCPATLRAAELAAGSVPFAVDKVMQGELQAAFCLVRPPGHHAEKDRAMGFCFFNNVAVGAAHALQQYELKRIAILDFDVHHGNGTQHIYQHSHQVLFCSSYENPLYPWYDQDMDNEHIITVPLAAGTTGPIFRERVQAAWFDVIDKFAPEFIFISAGFDAHAKDPLAHICLEVDDYIWLTKEIVKLAHKHCQGRIVSVLEGGYNLDALAECVPAHINFLSQLRSQ